MEPRTIRLDEEGGEIKIGKAFVLSIVASGATSIVTQVILLREFLSAFYGNELVLGIVLASWMLLTGIGSFLGRYSAKIRSRVTLIVFSLILIAILPPATVLLFRVLRNVVFPVGGTISISGVLYSSFALLMPYCLISGFMFSLFALTISELYRANLITRVYSLEAIGSIAGGVVFNLVLVFFLKTFQSLLVVLAFDCVVAFVLSLRGNSTAAKYTVASVLIGALVLGVVSSPDDVTKALLFRDQHVLYYKDTPYGSLTITSQGGQENFYEDNLLLFSTNDATQNEEAVHYAMIQHSNPRTVLLISGGISGMTKEILKYGVDRIDYVELNPWIVDIGKSYTAALANEKVRVISEDGRLFVKRTPDRYDVVLINVPEPSTAQLNRFYTVEFFQELQHTLNNGAVISLGLSSSADYLSGEARAVKSILYNTLATAFGNILIVPGLKDYFVASNRSLDIGIARLIGQKNIHTVYVNGYYIDDELLKQRSDYIKSTLNGSAALNRDFTPVSYYRQTLYWLSQFEFNYWIIVAVVVLLLASVLWKLNAISFGIFAGGFAASSLEVVLLISFQILYGYVYQLTGILITVFMGGLAFGSLFRHKLIPEASMSVYAALLSGVGVYAAALPFILMALRSAPVGYAIVHAAFFLLTCIIAMLIGAQFSVASSLQKGRVASVASGLYGVDLVGSAIGALVVAACLIPLMGMVNVCFVIAGLSFTGGLISFLRRKSYLISTS